MEMDDAVRTITQILCVIDRTPILYESVCPAPENALNRKSPLVENPQPGRSLTGMSAHYPPAQNFRIILR